ncbi:MAG: hypothetical protein F7C33_04895 [Desulfurococcales archaeon]|nr:hypothetical protein [Desulfurococcales archaeon]
MKITPIYTGAEPLYKALARATSKARDNSEWLYVRERLDEITTLYEALLEYKARAGLALPRTIVALVKSLEGLEEPSVIIEKLSEIEARLRGILPYYKATSLYATRARLAASLLLVIIAGYLLYIGGSLEALVVAVTGVGLGVSGLFTYTSLISSILVLAGAILQGLIVERDPYLVVAWILAVLASAIASVLPLAFKSPASYSEGV